MMPNKLFTQKPRRSPLPRVLGVVLVLALALYGGYHYFSPALPSLGEVTSSAIATATSATAPVATPLAANAATVPGNAPEVAPGDVVAQANQKLIAEDVAGARTLLAPIMAGQSDAALLPQALIVQAEVELASQQREQALALAERAMREFPASPSAPEANALYARLLEESGRAPEAEAIFARLQETAPKGMRATALSGLARKAEREGKVLDARVRYREALGDAAPGTRAWEEALKGLGRLNTELIFSREETPETKYYSVERGDNLTGIGIKLNTTQGLLMRANGLGEEARLNLGQRLKYTPKDFRLVVERSTCRIFLLDNEGLFKGYRTGLGMPGHETALGNYTIGNKQKDPVWHPQGRAPVASGAPDNELGTRWMPLVPAAPNLPDDLGIHGTIAPETIGQYKSHGCPRMLKEDVEELYDLVVRSTPVQIVETINWADVLKSGGATATVAMSAGVGGATTGASPDAGSAR